MFVYSENKKKLYPNGGKDENEYAEQMPPGVYSFGQEFGLMSSRPYFKKSEYDRPLIEITGAPFDAIKHKVMSFARPDVFQRYKEFGVIHYMGVLLYGPPGTGKTGLSEWLFKELASKHNAVIIRIKNYDDVMKIAEIVNIARKDDNQLIVLQMEELDKLLDSGSAERKFLMFTDGEETPNNLMIFATTNNFMDLPSAIRDRPSRFGVREEIVNVPAEIMSELINKMTPEKYKTGQKVDFSELTYKLSENGIKIDQVKHVLLNVFAHELSVDDAIKDVKSIQEAVK